VCGIDFPTNKCDYVKGSIDLSRNSIVENGWSALTLNDETHNNKISENNMTSNNLAVIGHCINLYRSSNNTIQKNNITGEDNGIRLEYWSNYNIISQNSITSNTWIDRLRVFQFRQLVG